MRRSEGYLYGSAAPRADVSYSRAFGAQRVACAPVIHARKGGCVPWYRLAGRTTVTSHHGSPGWRQSFNLRATTRAW